MLKKGIIPVVVLSMFIGVLYKHSKNNEKKQDHLYTTQINKNQEVPKKSGEHKKKKEKNDQPDEFFKFHQRIRTREGEKEPGYKPNYRLNELKKAKIRRATLKSATAQLDWKERGPGNISGRTRALIIDPDDPINTWFAGSASGGIWKTTNAGNSWRNLTNSFPNLATGALAMAASNTQVIYAGTGEGFFGGGTVGGLGIFKSIDKGESWEQLESTTQDDNLNNVTRLVVDPKDENSVLASTPKAIMKSVDGGQNWEKVLSGNIQQIVADPSDFNLLYATSNGMGILKSTDAGLHWEYILYDLSGRIELALSPTNPNIIFAKDESLNVYSSFDSGSSWSVYPVERTNDYGYGDNLWFNNALAVSPNDTTVLYIGGVDLYKLETGSSTDSSSINIFAYTQNIGSYMWLRDFHQNYLNGAIDVNTSNSNFQKIEIQFGAGKSQMAHRFLAPAGSTSGVPDSLLAYSDYVEVPFEVWDTEENRQLMVSFRDQDRNGLFNLASFNDSLLTGREYIWINNVDYSDEAAISIAKLGGQIFNYCLMFWPVLADSAEWNPTSLPESKIAVKKNTIDIKDYKRSLVATSYPFYNPGEDKPYMHADIHNIQYANPKDGNSRMVVTNDGGISYSDDQGISWNNPTNGYNTTQFYGVDKYPAQDRYVGGMQDNGSSMSPENPDELSEWQNVSDGDGFDAVVNAGGSGKLITSTYFNTLYLTDFSDNSTQLITTNIQDNSRYNASFFTQIGYLPQQPDKLYLVGKSGVTISEDFGLTWKLTALDIADWGWHYYGYVVPSPADPELVWAASKMTSAAHIHVSSDGGKSFNPVNSYDYYMGTLTGMAAHPTEANTAYALFSFAGAPKILRTTDLGQTWKDITQIEDGKSNNGFPDVAVYSLLVMPYNPNIIWVGTEIGLFISNDNGESWEYADNGLPAVSIWEMKISGSQVVMATHGRGIWSVQIPELANNPLNPILAGVGTSPANKTNIRYNLLSAYDSVAVFVDKEQKIVMPANTITDRIITQSFDLDLLEGKHAIQLAAYKDNKTLNSTRLTFFVVEYTDTQTDYRNSFDKVGSDFIDDNDEFSVIALAALGDGMALHSPHPYPEGKNISCYLKVPILISDASSQTGTLSYRDIPMVEEGEMETVFGSSEFWDYVVVEGSVNGIDWTPLQDGYDYRLVKDLAEDLGKTSESEPSAEMFVQHDVKLLDNFNAGDSLLIRFYLFSDPNTVGWGWVIDDIIIQQTNTAIHELEELVTNIFPNPCTSHITIEMTPDILQKVQLNIYDMSGRKVASELVCQAGRLEINTSQLKTATYILEIKTGDKVDRKKFQVKQ